MDLLRGFQGTVNRPGHVSGRLPCGSSKCNFPLGEAQRSSQCPLVSSMTLETQERLLTKGMINLLGLIPDDLVWTERSAQECVLHFHPELNGHLVSEAKELTELVTSHCLVRGFIFEYQSIDYSLTLQSLVSCLNEFLKKFRLSLVTLAERAQKLTLKLLQQALNPQRAILLTLADLCSAISKDNLNGASILSLLHTRIGSTGHSVVKELYECCLQKAMQPYSMMLRQWLKGQHVYDPRQEFMIQTKPTFLRDADSVTAKYEVVESRVPVFFEDLTQVIITAGCYAEMVNTVQQEYEEEETAALTVDKCMADTEDPMIVDGCLYVEKLRRGIQGVLTDVSATLFNVMNKFGELQEHLASLKEVYLFVRADIFTRFCELSRSQLVVNSSMCSPMVLKNFLADAVTGSAASTFTQSHLNLKFLEEPLGRRLVFHVVKDDELAHKKFTQLFGSRQEFHTFECITTDLRGGWILQHLLDNDVREMYELMFGTRLQLFLGESFCADVMPHCCGTARTLLQRMLVFTQSVSAYFSIFSVEQEWSRLQKRLLQVRTVDSLTRMHSDYVRRIFQRCLLNNLEASSYLLNIVSIILQAAVCIDRLVNKDAMVIQSATSSSSRSCVSGDAECSVDVERELCVLEIAAMPDGNFMDIIEYFEKQFNVAVAKWLDVSEIKTHEQLLTLLSMNECYVVRESTIVGFDS